MAPCRPWVISFSTRTALYTRRSTLVKHPADSSPLLSTVQTMTSLVYQSTVLAPRPSNNDQILLYFTLLEDVADSPLLFLRAAVCWLAFLRVSRVSYRLLSEASSCNRCWLLSFRVPWNRCWLLPKVRLCVLKKMLVVVRYRCMFLETAAGCWPRFLRVCWKSFYSLYSMFAEKVAGCCPISLVSPIVSFISNKNCFRRHSAR